MIVPYVRIFSDYPLFPIFSIDAHPIFVHILDDYPILCHVKLPMGIMGIGEKKAYGICI
jgi:hypothetical protein